MQNRRAEYISIGMGLLLGVFSLAFGTFDPLWGLLGLSNDIRGSLTIALSMFSILVGFLFAYYFQHANTLGQQEESSKRLCTELERIVHSFAQVSAFAAYSGEGALRVISGNIKNAKVVLNTKVTTGSTVFPATPASLLGWERSLCAAIRAGTTFREVVTPGWRAHAEKRRGSLKDAAGVYECSCITCDLAAFLNFTIFIYGDGSKEVFFGCAMSHSHGFDQPCIRTSERRVVQLFENWHADLFAKGEVLGAEAS